MLTFFHAHLETRVLSQFLREGYRVGCEQIPSVQKREATQCTRPLKQGKAHSKAAVSVPLEQHSDLEVNVHHYGLQAALHRGEVRVEAVSYTHLTLPTKRIV